MSKDFDLLAELAKFARANDIPLTDPGVTDRFSAEIQPRLKAALKDRTLVFGMRAERLFEAMVVSLGKFRLFKSEDVGVVHGVERFRAPDFRVVLKSGEQWLIEVKNVHRPDPSEQVSKIEAAYLGSLQRYCEAVGAPLYLAHFWSTWGLWTIVEAQRFVTNAGGLRVEMAEAMLHSRLGDLGDVSIALPGPLEFSVSFARDRAGKAVHPKVAFFRDGQLLTGLRDQNLAMILFQFGEWVISEPTDEDIGDGITKVTFKAEPREPSDQGFDFIGQASRVFSRFYREDTSAEEQVTQLNGQAQPEWFKPLSAWDFNGSKLALRIFHYQAKKDNLKPIDSS